MLEEPNDFKKELLSKMGKEWAKEVGSSLYNIFFHGTDEDAIEVYGIFLAHKKLIEKNKDIVEHGEITIV